MKKLILVEVNVDSVLESARLELGEGATLNESILREAGWMEDSGIHAIEVRDVEE